jgi:hypothetical protein
MFAPIPPNAGDDRFAGNQLAIHVTRHWYQHCYDDHVHGATRSRHPLAEVTDGQEREVVQALSTGEIRRIVGADGIPLVTAHGTALTPVERDLAAGLAGLVSPVTDTEHHTDPAATLHDRVTRTWSDLGSQERSQWLHLAGAHHETTKLGWSDLPGETQTKIIHLYLDTHRPDQIAVPFIGQPINGAPAAAAMSMFDHRAPLTADTVSSGVPTEAAVILSDDRRQAAQVEVQRIGRSQTR